MATRTWFMGWLLGKRVVGGGGSGQGPLRLDHGIFINEILE